MTHFRSAWDAHQTEPIPFYVSSLVTNDTFQKDNITVTMDHSLDINKVLHIPIFCLIPLLTQVVYERCKLAKAKAVRAAKAKAIKAKYKGKVILT